MRLGPQLFPQPPQFAASVVGFTHLELHAICGAVQTRVTHWLPVQIFPSAQSESPQQAKQPVPAQHRPPLAQDPPELHTPPLQVSAVHELPSLHCALLQHCAQLEPQSLGVVGAQAQLPALQSAPLLQAVPQSPQCKPSVSVFTSQSAGLPSQSA